MDSPLSGSLLPWNAWSQPGTDPGAAAAALRPDRQPLRQRVRQLRLAAAGRRRPPPLLRRPALGTRLALRWRRLALDLWLALRRRDELVDLLRPRALPRRHAAPRLQ